MLSETTIIAVLKIYTTINSGQKLNIKRFRLFGEFYANLTLVYKYEIICLFFKKQKGDFFEKADVSKTIIQP